MIYCFRLKMITVDWLSVEFGASQLFFKLFYFRFTFPLLPVVIQDTRHAAALFPLSTFTPCTLYSNTYTSAMHFLFRFPFLSLGSCSFPLTQEAEQSLKTRHLPLANIFPSLPFTPMTNVPSLFPHHSSSFPYT